MTWHAQAGQDAWVVEQLGGLRGGWFVDVGAYDGVEHSNTLALERDYGWSGLCVEPNPDAHRRLAASRSGSTCVCALASDRAVALPFDGIAVSVDAAARLTTADTLSRFLEDAAAPAVVDYLSVDVEGHELHVLDGIDFDRWHVRLVTVEHNLYRDGPDRKDAIHRRLSAAGFERVVEDVVAAGYGPYEDWYRNSRSLAS